MRSLSIAAVSLCALLAVSLTVSGASAPDGEPKNGPKPKIAFETDVIDLGEVVRGEKLVYTFTFENTGKADLEIERVKPSCGCTVAKFTELVKPGQKGSIVATVDTKSFRGPITKTVTVSSNDPVDSAVRLKTKATVKSLIDILPTDNVYFRVYKGDDQPTRKVITLRADKKNRFEVTSVKSRNKKITAKLLDKPRSDEDAASTYQIEIDVAEDVPVGPVRGQVKITTTHKKIPEITIKAHGQVLGQIVVTPLKVYLGKIPPKRVKNIKRTIRIEKRNATDFTLEKVTSSNPTFKLEKSEVEPGRVYTLTLTLDAEKLEPGALNGNIRIETNDKDEPVMQVPVYGSIAAAG